MTRIFVFQNPVYSDRIAMATINDSDIDPLERISQDGFYINEEDLPENSKDWFNCLEFDADKKIKINFEKAKLQTADRLRMEREPLLQKLDVLFQRALEGSKSLSQVETQKVRLRDITKLPNDCQTLGELQGLKCECVLRFEDLGPADISDNPEIIQMQSSLHQEKELLNAENQTLKDQLLTLQSDISDLKKILKKKFII
jgi:hypothetical protein